MATNKKTSQETEILGSGVDEANDIIRGARGSASNWKMKLAELYNYIAGKLPAPAVTTIKISLTAAQIQNANSTPIDIGLPVSGAGFYYRVTAFDVRFNFGTVPFTSTILSCSVSDGVTIGGQWFVQSINGTQSFFSHAERVQGAPTTNYVENCLVGLITDADSATGDSTMDCYVTVEKVAV